MADTNNNSTAPIQTLLIANRGEIACRVIKTAKRLGIKTVAVFSEADENSLHVQMADEAIPIGPAPSNESYLVIEKIIDAAKQCEADAVHPGFGFLSENAKFAQALDDAGIKFVGPGIRAIEVMGDKIESKKLAQSSGVNTVPGHLEALASPAEALTIAKGIGCPVMLKASAGGGGKGMRIAWTLDEVEDGFTSAQNEARSAFGDDRVFVEKFIERPRHIEIQILGDTHGNCLYLGERECSIQRRHQKVLEEAPSPFLDESTRRAMGEQAVQLSKAVNYHSAGTVEFIVDKEKNFYFLEMNTRLQVEHPVTECITGLDLVEQMIRVANGETLGMTQNNIKLNGWALEARVYAEDPDRNFMPSTGRLTGYQAPKETAQVRVDTGVYEGGEISMFYDPMIAKLVTYGPDRASAIASMKEALDSYVIRGVKHNIPFLSALVSHPAFEQGELTTGFIDEHYPDGFDSSVASNAPLTLSVIAAAWAEWQLNHQALTTTGQINESVDADSERVVFLSDHEFKVKLDCNDGDSGTVIVDGAKHQFVTGWHPGQTLMRGTFDDSNFVIQLDRNGNGWNITQGGVVSSLLAVSADVADMQRLMPVKTPPDMSRFLLSPMPGLLVRVSVAVGEKVEAGQELAIVEAMKMENVLFAEQGGVVKSIPVSAGSSLTVDEIIVEFD